MGLNWLSIFRILLYTWKHKREKICLAQESDYKTQTLKSWKGRHNPPHNKGLSLSNFEIHAFTMWTWKLQIIFSFCASPNWTHEYLTEYKTTVYSAVMLWMALQPLVFVWMTTNIDGKIERGDLEDDTRLLLLHSSAVNVCKQLVLSLSSPGHELGASGPVNPSSQTHSELPTVFTHWEFIPQVLIVSAHSSMSGIRRCL